MIQLEGRMPVPFKAHSFETHYVSQVEEGFICNTEKADMNPAGFASESQVVERE